MATRSTIGMITESGTVLAVYCHWDGYPSGVGQILCDYYSDTELVKKLISLGDISSLGQHIEEPHSQDKKKPDVTVFYGRDRGESMVDAEEYESVRAWTDAYKDTVSYLYLFTEIGWLMADYSGEFDLLDSVLEEILD